VAHDRLRLEVSDDGRGGADPAKGSGLVGLADRVEALGGTIEVHSPAGQGTSLQIDLPIHAERGRPTAAGPVPGDPG
jgi:signal transduction histidine kinase